MRTEDGYIIHKCLNGDSTAFGFLIDKYKAGVYASAYEKLRNFHDAEDIAQEAFFKAYRNLRTLRRWDSFASWLYRITLNLCTDWIRAESRRPDRDFIEDQDQEMLEAPSRDTYRQELVCESVREVLDSLPETHRQILTLHHLAGMTSAEIARFIGISPSAIRMRLAKARSLLKEEILSMMSTTFKEQRLQSSFTLRIVNAIKRMRIQPTSRTGGLPWGLSMAAGIIFAVLNLIPQSGILSRAAAVSQPPSQTKVLRTGEIPVDILEVSEIPTIASEQGGGDGGEHGTSDTRNAILAVANDEGIQTQESKEVITDPETGVEYIKTRTLTGEKDVIKDMSFNLSPNGKFLLWDKLVIPLGDGEPFDLVDVPASRGIWSPDGRKVVFCSEGAIWVIPVSPETGRPTGSAEKLIDGEHWYERCCWSPDSERIVISRRDKEAPANICILSVKDGALTQITNSGRENRPIWSPDGKTIAYLWGYQLRAIPAEGGSPSKLVDRGRPDPVSWSPDSQWIVYFLDGLRFLCLADGREFVMNPPDEVGLFASWSPDGKKMLFYRWSYDWKSALKVVSASGGLSCELGRQTELWPYSQQYWSPDSRMIVTEGKGKDGETGFLIVPLAGGDPFFLKLDVSVAGKPRPLRLSPGCRKLAFVVNRSDGKEDLYVVPVSLKDGRTTGSAVMVFSGWDRKHWYNRAFSWSPDGTKIAVSHEWNIWMAYAEGGEPVQITFRNRPENMADPGWSPDGKMIGYKVYHTAEEQILRIVPASGSEDKILLDIPLINGKDPYEWSADSKDLIFFSEGVISAISIADGKSRQMLDLRELPIDSAQNFTWSPDRRKLAFISWREADGKYQIFVVPADGSKPAELAADDPGIKSLLYWSPDGEWLSYNSDGDVKTRPGGEIWEANVSELLSSQEK